MVERTQYANGVPSWVDVTAKDIDAVAGFYSSVFGWAIEPVQPVETAMGYTMLTLRGTPVAAVSPPVIPGGAAWVTYFAVDDCDATVATARKLGADVLVEPMDAARQGRLAFLADPLGATFGLWQAYDHVGAGIVNEAGSWCFNHLATTDVDAALAFYMGLFGWQSEEATPGPGLPPYHRLVLDGHPVAGAPSTPMDPDEDAAPSWRGHGAGTPEWVVHISVDDCDATVERVLANGGTVVSPPTDNASGRGAACRDPQGAYFCVDKLQDRLLDA